MPGRNGQGPMGAGPLTGRGLGPFGGSRAYRGSFFGCRAGCGMRNGRFYESYYPNQNLSADEQKDMLEKQKAYLQSEIDQLQKTINEL